jgi:hypothetical protein
MDGVQVLHDLIDYENDFKWFSKERENMIEKYRGKTILIKDKDVKIIGENIEDVKEKATKLNIDISKSLVQFIPLEDITFII